MKNITRWINLSLSGLLMVGLSGLALRSKILFSLPFINYNRLLEAHSHFALEGWITLSLLFMMIVELLPPSLSARPHYQWILGGIAISSWALAVAFLWEGNGWISTFFSLLFILLTFIFSGYFLRDMRKSESGQPIKILSACAIVCLLLSSTGPLGILIMHVKGTVDGVLYRNSLFTYLHFQYNGFFTLALFALLFNYPYPIFTPGEKKGIYNFSLALCASILPSLFLSFLWKDHGVIFRSIASAGGLLLLGSLLLFLRSAWRMKELYYKEKPMIRFLTGLSLGFFIIKLILQIVLLVPSVGNAVFGNRPVIMGFLHLTFLGFVSLFILAFFVRKGWLDNELGLTRIAVCVFAISIILNEALLMAQGLTTMFQGGGVLFLWLLWMTGIGLFTGALLIILARMLRKRRAP